MVTIVGAIFFLSLVVLVWPAKYGEFISSDVNFHYSRTGEYVTLHSHATLHTITKLFLSSRLLFYVVAMPLITIITTTYELLLIHRSYYLQPRYKLGLSLKFVIA